MKNKYEINREKRENMGVCVWGGGGEREREKGRQREGRTKTDEKF